MKLVGTVKFMGNTAMIQADRPINLDDGSYDIDFKEISKKRSLQQNAYLWALIGEIAKKENGDIKEKDEIYCNLLKMAGAKYDVVMVRADAYGRFKANWRDVKKIKEVVNNHTVWYVVEAYYGSSQFNTNEMSQLIETTLKYAAEIGIQTDYWKEVLIC